MKWKTIIAMLLLCVVAVSAVTWSGPGIVWIRGAYDLFAQDASTEAMEFIDYEHHEIHSGSHYFVSGFETEASGGTIIFGFTTSDSTEEVHLIFEIAGTSQTEFYVYENSSFENGTSAVPFNNNRNSVKTSNSTVVKDPNMVTNGTLIESASSGKAGATPVASDMSGINDRNKELILKTNTSYTFWIISRDSNNIISYIGEWYEHTPKN